MLYRLKPRGEWNVPRERSRDRLVSELRLAGVATIDDANRVLSDFLPRFNRRFGVPARSRKSPIAHWTKGCAWIGSCASSTGAESPGTTRSDTAGAPFNCCPARTGRATPEQLWMCLKDWTIASQCSMRGATSLPRKHHASERASRLRRENYTLTHHP